MKGFPGRQVKTCRCALWLAAVESFDLHYNLRFKINGAEVEVGGVKSIGSSDLSESESKLTNIPRRYVTQNYLIPVKTDERCCSSIAMNFIK